MGKSMSSIIWTQQYLYRSAEETNNKELPAMLLHQHCPQ